MIYKEILEKIKQYDTIIIHRHSKPDFDAIGSQVGFKEILQHNFPKKNVYVVGDQNKFDKDNDMQDIKDEVYKDSLVFILDVAVARMVGDDRYKLAKEVIVIDHHTNDCDIENVSLFVGDANYSSAAELIGYIALDLNLEIPERGASFLFAGMVTDTGRFQWLKNPEKSFKMASILTGLGAKTTELYDFLYVESLEQKKMKIDFQSRFVFEDGVAYLKNDQSVFDKYDVDVFYVSRGMVNLAAGIEEIKIWLNFTYDQSKDIIFGEFRSRGVVIVDVAKSYGGGGHDNACGASIKDWATVDLIIEDFKKLLKGDL